MHRQAEDTGRVARGSVYIFLANFSTPGNLVSGEKS